MCLKNEAEIDGFIGLVQSKQFEYAMKILKINKFTHQRFLCLKCLKV